MTDRESKLRQRTDGRLDRSRDPAILNAALAALAEYGYGATNMNDIAARAGVGKAAIYRRWSSKAALITDALVYWRPDLMSDEAPDTGSLTGDFELLVERAARNNDDLISNDLVRRVAMEAARDPELATALDDLILHRGRRRIETILKQAAARGEISGDRYKWIAMSSQRATPASPTRHSPNGFHRIIAGQSQMPKTPSGRFESCRGYPFRV
jgi:AcrR family transcriptional regulator